MYAKENSRRLENNYKPRKIHNMPSFSSTLLDEIYRSTDEKPEDLKEKPVKKQTSVRTKINRGIVVEDEETPSFRRSSLIDKWMMMDKNKSLQDNDLLFFSSTSSSSDSSGALSSSDTESFGTTKTKSSKVSCFTTTRPKPIRTSVSARDKEKKPEDHQLKKNKMEDDLMKYRSRALKVYAKLKEMKQPISPGARLTSFISTLFNNNANGKKSRNLDTNKGLQDLKSLRVTPSSSSTCSSASSFSRSCLSKFSPKSREKMRDGLKRTVRFHPVIVEEDSRSCGHETLYGKPPLPPNALEESKNRKIEEAAQNVLEGCLNQRRAYDCSTFRNIAHEVDEDEEEEDYDAMSDSSSDLFEIDHLSLFGNNIFCEELPVYETTNLETNRTVASGLIR